MNVFLEFLKHFVWLYFRTVFIIFRSMIWYMTGVNKKLDTARQTGSYKGSTHVRKILFRFNFDPVEFPATETVYMTIHDSFQDPEYVLKDNVTLLHVNKNEAYFVESDLREDVLNSDHGAFVRVAQFKLARKFIVMPLHCFHQLAESLPETKQTIVFLSNTARCGSTLLTQVFEETGCCVAWAEPDSMNAITQLKGKMGEANIDRIAKNAVKLLCKPLSRHVDVYILKIMQPSMIAIPRLHRLYPDAIQLFMYRDALPNIKSFTRFGYLMPTLDLLLRLGQFSATFTALFMRAMGLPDEHFEEKLQSRSHFSAIIWGSGVRQYLDFREQGIPISACKYEDIINNTQYSFQKIFEYIGMKFDSTTGKAISTAFSRDSQRGTPVNRKACSEVKPEVVDERVMRNINEVCQQFGLPPASEPFEADGTITSSERKAVSIF